MYRDPPGSPRTDTLFPATRLFRSRRAQHRADQESDHDRACETPGEHSPRPGAVREHRRDDDARRKEKDRHEFDREKGLAAVAEHRGFVSNRARGRKGEDRAEGDTRKSGRQGPTKKHGKESGRARVMQEGYDKG